MTITITVNANRAGSRRGWSDPISPLTMPGYEDERIVAFREQWLPALHPGTDFSGVPLSYLQELYVNIWAYGPHGDTYRVHLSYFLAELDRMRDETDYVAPFVSDLKKAFKKFRVLSAMEKLAITYTAQKAHIPAPLNTRVEDYKYAHWLDIVDHALIQDLSCEYPKYPGNTNLIYLEDFMSVFVLFCLYQDVIAEMPGETMVKLRKSYVKYCAKWGLPS